VIITRARAQSEELTAALRDLGADVVEIPVIELVEPADASELEACVARLSSYDWIVFSSANAVEFFMRRVPDVREMRARVCAIGAATAAAVRELRVPVDLIPAQGTAEGVAAAFQQIDVRGNRVLYARAAAAREVIPSALAAAGALVDAPETYRNVIPGDAAGRVEAYLTSGRRADWIVFASPSAVKNFLALAGVEALVGVRVATIGPTTSDAVRKHTLPVDAEAATPSVEALVRSICSPY
jgi:uroporphyrinogen III methyltransferase/synthase